MKKPNLIWIDLEMTGLDLEKHVILEIAAVVTDGMLEIVAEGPNIAIHYPEKVFSPDGGLERIAAQEVRPS
jgi:oligoribonuclease